MAGKTQTQHINTDNHDYCFCQCLKTDTYHKKNNDDNFRLDKHVIPSHYDIHLEPDLDKFTFTGKVEISVNILEPTDSIKINVKELEIKSISIQNQDNTYFNGCAQINPTTEIANIYFNGQLGQGDWTLKIGFSGILNDSLKGFYRSFWTDKDGHKKAVATTQFESTDARRCFPCFDEPEFKATYKVYLTVPKELTALSNGRIVKSEIIKGSQNKLVEFATTMKMSTYLLAFIVGEFECSDPVYVNGIELKVWANPGKKELMDFALKSASHAIAWFENYYECKYPGGDKIDFIAINDFAAGAMENLGCITFRETALLINEKTATQGELERVAEVVMHELAHMWFGDLVTMKWWNGLWLNESFATFMEAKALDAWRPAWKIWDKFAVSRAAASRVDSLNSTHPIECPVNKPEEAAELFDVISYEKGCSTLYQIEQFISEEVFRQGIVRYLRKHAWANTQTHDLWDCLEEAALASNLNYNVRNIMDAWVFTAGHPVISVKNDSKRDGYIEVEQEPFKFIKSNLSTLWPVPITMSVTSKDKKTISKFVLDQKRQTVYVGENPDYIILNANGTGFYRVAYASDLLKKLSLNVSQNLSVVERFNLVNDTWACVRAKLTNAVDYLKLIELFNSEKDPSVWAIILGSLKTLQTLLPKPERSGFAKMVTNLVNPVFSELGFSPKNNESVQIKQLRGSLMSALGTLGEDKTVQHKACELFEAWIKDKNSIDSNLLPAIVNILSYTGDKEQYNKFKNLFKTSTTPQDINRFMYSLTDFSQSELLTQTLESCINGDFRSQDAPYVINRVLTNEDGSLIAWDFIKKNWPKLIENYPVNGVVRMVGGISALDTSKDLLADVKDFFAKHPVEAGNMALAQAMEQQLINYEMREHHAKALNSHFLVKI